MLFRSDRLELFEGGRVSCVALSYEDAIACGVDVEELDALIDMARCVLGVEVSFAIKQKEAGEMFRISMRSDGKVDVSEICKRFDGGGHPRAAGGEIVARSAEDAKNEVLREVVKSL